MCEYPKMPHGEYPHIFSAIHALGFEFSQSEYSSRWHMMQRPHAIGNGTTTRSPGRRFLTLRAHLLHLAHELVADDVPLLHGRNEPVEQMKIGAADRGTVIRTMASRGLMTLGSGTSRTSTRPVPIQQVALMIVLLPSPARHTRSVGRLAGRSSCRSSQQFPRTRAVVSDAANPPELLVLATDQSS